jgi:hypothetical protein
LTRQKTAKDTNQPRYSERIGQTSFSKQTAMKKKANENQPTKISQRHKSAKDKNQKSAKNFKRENKICKQT